MQWISKYPAHRGPKRSKTPVRGNYQHQHSKDCVVALSSSFLSSHWDWFTWDGKHQRETWALSQMCWLNSEGGGSQKQDRRDWLPGRDWDNCSQLYEEAQPISHLFLEGCRGILAGLGPGPKHVSPQRGFCMSGRSRNGHSPKLSLKPRPSTRHRG